MRGPVGSGSRGEVTLILGPAGLGGSSAKSNANDGRPGAGAGSSSRRIIAGARAGLGDLIGGGGRS